MYRTKQHIYKIGKWSQRIQQLSFTHFTLFTFFSYINTLTHTSHWEFYLYTTHNIYIQYSLITIDTSIFFYIHKSYHIVCIARQTSTIHLSNRKILQIRWKSFRLHIFYCVMCWKDDINISQNPFFQLT